MQTLRLTNDHPAPAGWTEVLFRQPGWTPFSDNVNPNVPELTMARARECVDRAAGRPIIVNVEEVLPEHRRIATLNAEIRLLKAALKEPTLLIPYGIWGEDDYECRLLLPVFQDAGCVPVPMYVGNPPRRAQGGRFDGTSIGGDIERALDNAERWKTLLPGVPRVAWVNDRYVFPAEDGGEVEPLSDQDVKLLGLVFRHTGDLLNGVMYWRDNPGFDPRFDKLAVQWL